MITEPEITTDTCGSTCIQCNKHTAKLLLVQAKVWYVRRTMCGVCRLKQTVEYQSAYGSNYVVLPQYCTRNEYHDISLYTVLIEFNINNGLYTDATMWLHGLYAAASKANPVGNHGVIWLCLSKSHFFSTMVTTL